MQFAVLSTNKETGETINIEDFPSFEEADSYACQKHTDRREVVIRECDRIYFLAEVWNDESRPVPTWFRYSEEDLLRSLSGLIPLLSLPDVAAVQIRLSCGDWLHEDFSDFETQKHWHNSNSTISRGGNYILVKAVFHDTCSAEFNLYSPLPVGE